MVQVKDDPHLWRNWWHPLPVQCKWRVSVTSEVRTVFLSNRFVPGKSPWFLGARRWSHSRWGSQHTKSSFTTSDGTCIKGEEKVDLSQGRKGCRFFGGYEALLHHRVILKSLWTWELLLWQIQLEKELSLVPPWYLDATVIICKIEDIICFRSRLQHRHFIVNLKQWTDGNRISWRHANYQLLIVSTNFHSLTIPAY